MRFFSESWSRTRCRSLSKRMVHALQSSFLLLLGTEAESSRKVDTTYIITCQVLYHSKWHFNRHWRILQDWQKLGWCIAEKKETDAKSSVPLQDGAFWCSLMFCCRLWCWRKLSNIFVFLLMWMDPFQGKMVQRGEEGLTLSPTQARLGKLISRLHLHVYLLLTVCECSLLILFSLAYSPAPSELL